MREVQAMLNEDIHLGRRGENLATCVTFDVSEWQGAGEGTVHLLHQRNGDMHPYPCAITVENGVATWVITASDVEFAGRGKAELQYLDGEVCIKSAVFTTKTLRALGRAGEEPPAPHEGWVHQVLEAAGNTEGWAEEADASARSARESAAQARGAAQTAATDAANAAAGMAAQQAAEHAVGQVEGRLSGHVADAQNAAQRANQSAQAASQSVSVAHDHAGDALWAANQAQKAATQAKDDADRAEAAAEREFLAVYGETSFADIESAIAAGRAVYLLDGERKVPFSFITDMGEYKDASFYHHYGVFRSSFYVRSDTNKWWKRTDALQDVSDKVQSITSESAVNQYPSAKAVYEYGQTLEKTFTAKYGETTLAEVEAAYVEGKTLFCVWDGNLYCQSAPTDYAFFFEGVFGNTKRKLSLNRANGRWMDVTPTTLLTAGHISADVYDASGHEDVPSVKAVYDYVQSLEIKGGCQPDWNQNDETAADYIRNRPFYDVYQEVVEAQPVVTAYSEEEDAIVGRIPCDWIPEPGDECLIVIDGNGRVCTVEEFDENRVLRARDDGDILADWCPQFELAVYTEDAGEHTVSVKWAKATTLLPNKYLDTDFIKETCTGVGGPLMVTFQNSGNTMKADKTYAEVLEASKAGKQVAAQYPANNVYGLTLTGFSQDLGVAMFSNACVDVMGDCTVYAFELHSDNAVTFYTDEYPTKTQMEEAIEDIAKSAVQPDWSQDDETAADFIKNRPFYGYGTVVAPQQTVAMTDMELDEPYYWGDINGVALVAGNKYTVIFNGQSYECVAYEIRENLNNNVSAVVLGDEVLAMGEYPESYATGTGNGEPFSINYPIGAEDLALYTRTGESHTVSIYEGESKKLDSKYLDMGAIKASMPRLNLTATFADGTTQTYNLYGEAVAE